MAFLACYLGVGKTVETLRAIRVDEGRIVATASDGTEFMVEVDDAIRAALRQAALREASLHEPTLSTGAMRKVPVRDIQAHIRQGMTAEQVAEITGFPVHDIRRYEGPVLAEREHVATSALAVPVQLPGSGLDAPSARFGSVIGRRLEQLAARGSRWASWKDPKDGWMIKLTFTADGVDHDARWSFDVKKSLLAPLNSEAVALSQQHEATGTLMPRLRALAPDAAGSASQETTERDGAAAKPTASPAPAVPDSSRFDSAIFDLTPREPKPAPTAPAPSERPTQRDAPAASGTPIVGTAIVDRQSGPAPRLARDVDTTELLPERGARPDRAGGPRRIEPRTGSTADAGRDTLPPDLGETADLLDALRRRRSEREAAAGRAGLRSAETEEAPRVEDSRRPTNATVKIFERLTPVPTSPLPAPPRQLPGSASKGPRRGRANLPSWDEIVFGARSDDEDPA